MKIILKIEKKHLIFFSIFLVLISAGFVIATEWEVWDSSKPSHEILYTNMIGPVDEDIIKVKDAALGVQNGIYFSGDNNNKFKIYATAGKMYYSTKDAPQTQHIFNGWIVADTLCSRTEEGNLDRNNCISVEDLINGNGRGNGGNEGGNGGSGGEENNLHVSGSYAQNYENYYLKDINEKGGYKFCEGIIFGFENVWDKNDQLDKFWCDKEGTIDINIMEYKEIDSSINGGILLCKNDEIVCGVKNREGQNNQLDMLYCCKIDDNILIDISNKREVDITVKYESAFCNIDEIVCGAKNREGQNDKLDKFYCCKLLED